MEQADDLVKMIERFTIPSSDNGTEFVVRDRLEAILGALAGSKYRLFRDKPLAKVYAHGQLDQTKPVIIVSCHIDSLYDNYFCKVVGDEIAGTFDNSATNAVLVHAMLNGRLHPQVIAAFTGDEEHNMGGVDQVVESLQEDDNDDLWENSNLIITLDLTEEGFGKLPFTVENIFIEEETNDNSVLRFGSAGEFIKYLEPMIGQNTAFIIDAEPDETWEYDEFDFNCFSFCLPCRCIEEDDMHSDMGVAIRIDSIGRYSDALSVMTRNIATDMLKKRQKG